MTPSIRPTPDAGEFKGKRILVTGGTKGAGKAIADRFLQGGGTVIITARSAPEEKTASYFIRADVSTPEGTTNVIRERRGSSVSPTARLSMLNPREASMPETCASTPG